MLAEIDFLGADSILRLRVGQGGKKRAEQLELAAGHLDLAALARDRAIDLDEQLVDVVELAAELREPLFPRLQVRVVLVELVRRALQLDQPPDPELVPVILGRRALEVIERRLVVAAIVQDVREVDARFGVLVVHLERLAQRRDGRVVLAEPMLRVADAGDRLGALGRLLHRDLEELLRDGEQLAPLAERRLAEQRAADLEHQVEVVGVAELERATEAAQRRLLEPELEQRLAEAGQRVLVLRLEDQRLLEAPARPGELLAGESRVPHTDVQLYRGRVEREPFPQNGQRLVVLPFVVELVGALVVLFGAQERGGHGD